MNAVAVYRGIQMILGIVEPAAFDAMSEVEDEVRFNYEKFISEFKTREGDRK